MTYTRAKKYYGQHFLTDRKIAQKIAGQLRYAGIEYHYLIEVGPGRGILTDEIIKIPSVKKFLIEIDRDLIDNLVNRYGNQVEIVNKDFLELDMKELVTDQTGIIGNFPYNISSQIVLKIIENRNLIYEAVGMFQRELAERLVSMHGKKSYGKISVFTQLYYQVKVAFHLKPGAFVPPPQVNSSVVHFVRKKNFRPDCNEALLWEIITDAFGQRRKKLKNTLPGDKYKFSSVVNRYFERRPEELSPEDFVLLAQNTEKIER